jgi:hypothetical protein
MKTKIVKLKQLAVMTGLVLGGVGGSGAVTPANALSFNFTSDNAALQAAIASSATDGSPSEQAATGFQQAGAWWSSLLTDNVTVNIKIDFKDLGAGTLAAAGSYQQQFSYTNVRTALISDKSSNDDNAAVSSLPSTSAFNVLINRTTNNSGSATPYLDNDGGANNNTIQITTANAKAIGLRGANDSGLDVEISFNSQNYIWDFNGSDGIATGSFDFVGIAAHEIGHGLGFVSGVDLLDNNTVLHDDNFFNNVTTLDLFRYSDLSGSNGKAIDFSADARDKYFSLDGGVTKIASFSTGVNFGDQWQASHWKDSLGIGIMDPTSAPGELLQITENDNRALDVIGYDRRSTTKLPEPADFVGTLIFAAFGGKIVLKRRQQLMNAAETEGVGAAKP